jgi:hypothetical protein
VIAAVLLACALVSEPGTDGPSIDVSLPLGVGWHARVDGPESAGALHYGLAAGGPIRSVHELARAEVMLSSSTDGPPWGTGVDAVKVARLNVDLVALAGVSWAFVDEGAKTLGVEALAGPRLRLTRVTTSIYGSGESHSAVAIAAKGAAGPFATYQAFRMSLRAAICVPWDRAVELWLGFGYGF